MLPEMFPPLLCVGPLAARCNGSCRLRDHWQFQIVGWQLVPVAGMIHGAGHEVVVA